MWMDKIKNATFVLLFIIFFFFLGWESCLKLQHAGKYLIQLKILAFKKYKAKSIFL